MTYKTAQLLGGLMAAALVAIAVGISRSLPPPCTGALTLQLHPPLTDPGLYEFELSWGLPAQRCNFEVQLAARAEVTRQECALPWQLQLRGRDEHLALSGLLLAATPEQLSLRVRHRGETLFDRQLTPEYGAQQRAERNPESEARFCGAATLVHVDCVAGTSQCSPFTPLCDGPEDCPQLQVCCAAPGWAREYGAGHAMECSSRGQCLGRIESYIACHDARDCPAGYGCEADAVGAMFKPPLRLCLPASAESLSAGGAGAATASSASGLATASPAMASSQSGR